MLFILPNEHFEMFLKSMYKMIQSSICSGEQETSSTPLLQDSPIIPGYTRGQGSDCRFVPDSINYKLREGSSWLTQIPGDRRAVHSETSHWNGVVGCGTPQRHTACAAKAPSGVLGAARFLSSPAGEGSPCCTARCHVALTAPTPFSKIRKKGKRGRGFPCAGKTLILL